MKIDLAALVGELYIKLYAAERQIEELQAALALPPTKPPTGSEEEE